MKAEGLVLAVAQQLRKVIGPAQLATNLRCIGIIAGGDGFGPFRESWAAMMAKIDDWFSQDFKMAFRFLTLSQYSRTRAQTDFIR